MDDLSKKPHPVEAVNLMTCKSICSTSIGKLLMYKKHANTVGEPFLIWGCDKAWRETFWLIRLDVLITVRDDPPWDVDSSVSIV